MTGGKAAGGSAGSTAARTGGNSSEGGVATGGSADNGGNLAGGSLGGGGSATGGATGLGGSAAGGASDTGGKTESPDASTAGYHPCPTDGTACKIMPFGDSITDGYNSDTPGGYRVELFRLAHSAGKNITFVGTGSNGPSTVDGVSFPPHHEGHSGWTIYPEGGRKGISECLQTNADCLSSNSVMPEYTPHIVLLMIGTNDAIDNYDMTNAPTRLGKLIDTIYDQLPNVLIVVAQPIPSRGDASKGDDTALSGRIKTYDDAIPAVVQARADAGKHILLVDMFTPFNPNKASLIEDQWHPNLRIRLACNPVVFGAAVALVDVSFETHTSEARAAVEVALPEDGRPTQGLALSVAEAVQVEAPNIARARWDRGCGQSTVRPRVMPSQSCTSGPNPRLPRARRHSSTLGDRTRDLPRRLAEADVVVPNACRKQPPRCRPGFRSSHGCRPDLLAAA